MTNTAKKKPPPGAENATESFETIASFGKETAEAVLTMGSEAAAQTYKYAAAFGKEGLDSAKDDYDKLATAGQDNLDAYLGAATAAFAGFEAYSAQILDYTKKAATQNADIVQKLHDAKTPQEIIDVQFEAVNNSVNRVIAQSEELSKITADTVAKSIAPVKDQIEKSVESFVKPFAV